MPHDGKKQLSLSLKANRFFFYAWACSASGAQSGLSIPAA